METDKISVNQTESDRLMQMTETYGARNYAPIPVVISKAKGVWCWDPEGRKYIDMMSAYSAVGHGHRHPQIIRTVKEQLKKVTLTSRAFYTEQLGYFLKDICEYTGYEMCLPMNTGAEAVETAIKTARKWGYKIKGVRENSAEIIVCNNNFHGRTITIISCSSEAQYKDGFEPLTPGFKIIKYGDIKELESSVNENTVAFLVEPIQGEAGIIVPPDGYLKQAQELCKKNKILFILDEIQTGFGRTGKKFAWEHEGANPDILILGKALGGGIMPISAVVSSKEILGVFKPGDHGSTFGGNPLACAVARTAMKVLEEEKLVENSAELGKYFMEKLRSIKSPHIKEIRGKGLFIGLEVRQETGGARKFVELLMKEGVLSKETHEYVIRFAPPLVITKSQINWALKRIKKVFKD